MFVPSIFHEVASGDEQGDVAVPCGDPISGNNARPAVISPRAGYAPAWLTLVCTLRRQARSFPGAFQNRDGDPVPPRPGRVAGNGLGGRGAAFKTRSAPRRAQSDLPVHTRETSVGALSTCCSYTR